MNAMQEANSHMTNLLNAIRLLFSFTIKYIYNTFKSVWFSGTDPAVEGQTRSFLAHPFCRGFLELEEGKTYLIMGQTTSLPRIGGR